MFLFSTIFVAAFTSVRPSAGAIVQSKSNVDASPKSVKSISELVMKFPLARDPCKIAISIFGKRVKTEQIFSTVVAVNPYLRQSVGFFTFFRKVFFFEEGLPLSGKSRLLVIIVAPRSRPGAGPRGEPPCQVTDIAAAADMGAS